MKIIQNLALATAFSIPFLSIGCNDPKSKNTPRENTAQKDSGNKPMKSDHSCCKPKK